MKITYISHSCFLVELRDCYILFDYAFGELPTMDKQKPLYVFASHFHDDHYSEKIFEIENNNLTWILSDDIQTTHPHISVQPGQEYEIGQLHVQTLRSTDMGVAFLVDAGDLRLYHAGDLNWWDWGEEDTPQESEDMKQQYLSEMKKIEGMHFDVVFLPVDMRLQERSVKGAEAFLKYVLCDVFVPMHFWKDNSVFECLRNCDIYCLPTTHMWLDFKELDVFIIAK